MERRKKKKNKNVYPIIIATVIYIYIIAVSFIIIFASNVGAVIDEDAKTITSLPDITRLDVDKDFKTVEVETSNMYHGPLVLVNNYYDCKFDGDDPVVVLENFNNCYQVASYDVKVSNSVMENLNNMLGDFYSATGNKYTMVSSGYRSRELQQELYDEDQEERAKNSDNGDEFVAVPGYSEHQTGYAMDFTVVIDGVTTTFDNEGDYSWVLNNCSKYGFILRYPEDKVGVTEIGYETWHYRYVGVPHSLYIQQNNLCLEEYINIVEQHNITSPLYINDNDLTRYMVYFVPASSDNKTLISVPKDREYEISGDNVNGFVVSIKL